MGASASSSPPRCEEKLSLSLRPPIIVPVKKECVKLEPNLQKGGNDFLYVESKRARLEREKEERKRKFEVELDFAPEDIALATVPGLDFDPKTRNFDMGEQREEQGGHQKVQRGQEAEGEPDSSQSGLS